MNKIIFSVENTCDIPLEELDKMGVKHISLSYRNETTNEENPNLTLKEFYDAIRKGNTFKTSLINEYEFEEYFKEIVKDGDVLHLGFDSEISGTYKSAKDAAEKINKVSENKVYVVDTLTGSGAQAILLYAVMKKAKEGLKIQDLVDYANDLKMRISLNFTPEDMKTLAKSGRLSKIMALLGTILNIKPIIYVNNEGKFAVRQKVISRKKAMSRLVEMFKENYNKESEYVYILHGDKEEDALAIKNEILKDERFKDVKIKIEYLGVIVGAHGGPGNLCLCYTANLR